MLLIFKQISWSPDFLLKSPDFLYKCCQCSWFIRKFLDYLSDKCEREGFHSSESQRVCVLLGRQNGTALWSLDFLLKSPDCECKAKLNNESVRNICCKFGLVDFFLDFLTVFGIGSRTYCIIIAIAMETIATIHFPFTICYFLRDISLQVSIIWYWIIFIIWPYVIYKLPKQLLFAFHKELYKILSNLSQNEILPHSLLLICSGKKAPLQYFLLQWKQVCATNEPI